MLNQHEGLVLSDNIGAYDLVLIISSKLFEVRTISPMPFRVWWFPGDDVAFMEIFVVFNRSSVIASSTFIFRFQEKLF